MTRIEGFRIQNYRVLKDIAMGRIISGRNLNSAKPLTPLAVVIGKNGSGKSSLFDAFGFLADCMDSDLETACNVRGRGGYEKLVTGDSEDEPLKITLCYRESENDCPITYDIVIGKNESGLPAVRSERLRQWTKNREPKWFLCLENGKGTVIPLKVMNHKKKNRI